MTSGDREILLKLCGGSVSTVIEAEYAAWASLYHGAGQTGDLGLQFLIPMLRSMDVCLDSHEANPEPVVWRNMLQDGSTRVEAQLNGTWKPGAFVGFSEGGMLAVKLDNDEMVREVRPDVVRLATEPGTTPVTSQTANDIDVVDLTGDDEPDENPKPQRIKAAKRKPKKRTPPPPRAEPKDITVELPSPAGAGYDWDDVPPQAPMWLAAGADYQDVTFESWDEESQQVTVRTSEGTQQVSPDRVQVL